MNKRFWLKLLYLILGFMLITVQVTDADLLDNEEVDNNRFTATTLDFSTNDTVNNSAKTLFFTLSGLVPGGFGVSSLRLVQQGELDFSYQLTAIEPTGSGALCTALHLKVLRNWQGIYDGGLVDVNVSGQINHTQTEDLVFALSLPNNDASLKGQTCSIKFKLISTKTDASHVKFSDEEILDNHINTGTW